MYGNVNKGIDTCTAHSASTILVCLMPATASHFIKKTLTPQMGFLEKIIYASISAVCHNGNNTIQSTHVYSNCYPISRSGVDSHTHRTHLHEESFQAFLQSI